MKEVHYEPHPVSPQRKRELQGQGYKIIDARFAPPGNASIEPAASKRARRAAAAQQHTKE